MTSEITHSIELLKERRAALITAASAVGAPVAPLVHLARPQDGLGEAHITRRISGETLGRKIVSDPRFEAVRPGLARQCGAILAQIHSATPPAGLKGVPEKRKVKSR